MTGAAAATTFSSTYSQARRRFLDAAAGAGLLVESKAHPARGFEGEDLAMDVARDGPPDAPNLLVLSSACHGVEGFCGSGVQVAALEDEQWREHARRADAAVLYIHALNPYGFSHISRATHENIDLNRNFHDFSKPLPVNEDYRELHPLLLPPEWPPSEANTAAVMAYIAKNGMAAFQSAISRGQHEFPQGLFFGGTGPSWSNLAVREALRVHGRRAARIAWIDFHTGLGPSGVGERIYAGRDEEASVARARQWWGGDGKTAVTSIYDGSSTSALLTGMMWSSVHDECPQADYTGIALEFGTLPSIDTLNALRGDHWLRLHPDAAAPLADAIRQQTRAAFYTETDEWKRQVLEQSRQALFQAVDGMAG